MHLVLEVRKFYAQSGRTWVVLTHTQPDFLIFWDQAVFEVVEGDLGLKHGMTTVNIKDHDHERCLVIFNFERDLRIHVLRVLTARRLGLSLLISLVANNVRVRDSTKVFGTNHRDVKHAHRSRFCQHLLRVLQLLVVLQNIFL